MVAVFVPGASFSFYVNGAHVGTITASVPTTFTNNGQLTIGDIATSGTTYRPFAGYIDDFRVYNTALSATQIATLYSQTAPLYTLWQQPIESFNISDLAWGTTAAKPATLSCWVKNNTATAQRFALSANNTGAMDGLIAYMPFDGDFADRVGTTLSGASPYGSPTIATSTGNYKVGTGAVYFANTAATAPSQYLSYAVPTNIQPQTVSFWFNPSAISASIQILAHFGSTTDTVNTGMNFRFDSTQVAVNLFNNANAGNIYTASVSTVLTVGSWYHLAVTYTIGGQLVLYLNGVARATTTLPTFASLVTYSTGNSVNCVQIGGLGTNNASAFNGYIDDFRIYNRPLTAAQIAQLYANNVSSTTTLTYLTVPRSIVYPSPSIPAGSWVKVSFTLPAETTGTWFNADNGAGVLLSLCLGASGAYATSNVAAVANNAVTAWNSVPEYTATDVQVFGGTAANFLAVAGNSILVTGVQFEKGSVATPFEFLAFSIQLALAQRFYEKSFALDVAPANGVAEDGVRYIMTAQVSSIGIITQVPFKIVKRARPSVTTYHTTNGANSKWAFYAAGWYTGGALNAFSNTNSFSLEYFGLTLTAYQSFIVQGNWTAEAEL
jgi:hypothetical protein